MRKSYSRNLKKRVIYWYLDGLGNLQQSVVRRPKNAMRTITETTYTLGYDEEAGGTVVEHHIERDGQIVRRFKTTTREEREDMVPAIIDQLFEEAPVDRAVYYWYFPNKSVKRAVRIGPNARLPAGVVDYLTERVYEITPGVMERTIGCRGYVETFRTPTNIDQNELTARYTEIIKTQAKKARTIEIDPMPDAQVRQMLKENKTRDLIVQRRRAEEEERQKAIEEARRMVEEVNRRRAEREGGSQSRRGRRATPLVNRAVKKSGTGTVLKNIKKFF
jgi:hypothetical protein